MKSIPVLRKAAIVSAVAGLLALGVSGPASAATGSPGASAAAQTQRTSVTNASCLAAMKAAQAPSTACTHTVVLTTSASTPVTSADLAQAKATMSPSEYASLAVAAATTAVSHRSYSQTISQITDQERQYGTAYYNGTRVWVTVAYSGYTGSHFCVVDYAVGYSISNNACADTGTNTKRTLTMNWNVSPGIIPRGPIQWNESFTMYVSSTGAVSQ